MSSVPIAAEWFSSISQFFKRGSKGGFVCHTANLMGLVQGFIPLSQSLNSQPFCPVLKRCDNLIDVVFVQPESGLF